MPAGGAKASRRNEWAPCPQRRVGGKSGGAAGCGHCPRFAIAATPQYLVCRRWMGGGAVDRTGLEMRSVCWRCVPSNAKQAANPRNIYSISALSYPLISCNPAWSGANSGANLSSPPTRVDDREFVTLILAALGLASGLVAAWLWYKSSTVSAVPIWSTMARQDPAADLRASLNGLMTAGEEAANRNRVAATWTAISVLLITLIAVLGTLPF